MMKRCRFFTLVSCLSLFIFSAQGQDRLTRQDYIQKYKGLALEQMEVYGIPASVKMAQALLESDDGNSRLAREANNHFGIKCKSTWTGATIAHDDDSNGECFRKYDAVEESFKDHSEFLDKSPRYQGLFKLDPTDYKGWATELKRAGYATNPQYDQMLIKIIEDNQLYLLDQGQDIPLTAQLPLKPNAPVEDIDESSVQESRERSADQVVDVDNYSIAVTQNGKGRAVYHNNGSEFVLSKVGDTYARIASEFGLNVKKLMQYNDVESGYSLSPNEMVYIKAKSKRSMNGKLIHIAKDGESMHSISQMYGIRLKSLCAINRRTKESPVRTGQQIRLM